MSDRKPRGVVVGGAAAEPQPPERRRVLVVEDYEDAREMYQEYLEFEGFQVEVARDGLEAIERAQQTHPDLILMDMSLPIVNGWEATRRLKLKEDDQTADIPVVALTGHVLPGHEDKAREVGCDDFVSKPAVPRDVAARIRALLSQPRRRPGGA